MLRVIVGLVALAVGATVVLAQNTAAITVRKDAMKALGGATKEPGAMAKGEAAFDLGKVQASLKTIAAGAG
jgi:cytochrome c556